MSLLDSACRIGHRKYLLNELVMRPTNTHDTFSDSNLVASGDGRIRESIDLWTRARVPRSFESTRMPSAPRDPWIRGSFDPWMFGLLQAGRSPKLRILGFRETLGLSVLGFGRSGSRILGFWSFRNNRKDRLILEYLDPYTQVVESTTESTPFIWKCDRGISFRSIRSL